MNDVRPIPSLHQQQQYRPMTLVSRNISIMWIFMLKTTALNTLVTITMTSDVENSKN